MAKHAKSNLLKFSFTKNAEEDYKYWLKTDTKIVQKINSLIENIRKTPFEGLGKPEQLRFDLSGCWSRRINQKHRLVYQVLNNELIILACRYHY